MMSASRGAERELVAVTELSLHEVRQGFHLSLAQHLVSNSLLVCSLSISPGGFTLIMTYCDIISSKSLP
jgi:hypothetical protein